MSEILIEAEAPEAMNSVAVTLKLISDTAMTPKDFVERMHVYVGELKRLGYKRRFVPQPSTAGKGKGPTKLPTGDEAKCPNCGGAMYDNVAANDKRAAEGKKLTPDFKCKVKECNGAIWRPKDGWVKDAAPATETGDRPPLAERVNGAEKPSGPPQGIGEFLNRALVLGYTRIQILAFAHTNDDELKQYTPEAWAELLTQLEDAKKAEA